MKLLNGMQTWGNGKITILAIKLHARRLT